MDQKHCRLFVMTDVKEGNGIETIPMGFLDSSGGWCSLGGQLFPGGLASGGFTGGLLGTGHVVLTPKMAGADLPREDQDLTPSLTIGDTNHARPSSARAHATTPAKAKKG